MTLSLNTKIDELQNKVALLIAALYTVRQDNARLQRRIDKLNGEQQRLEKKITGSQQKVDDMLTQWFPELSANSGD
ncbi:MAG: hypothetical protein ACK5NY_04825 [Burkholderiaceae bacterium]|jgi:hypothetical protein